MRRVVSLLLLVLLLPAFNVAGATQVAGQLTYSASGTVVEIFDADAIAVRLYDGRIAYVKLLGINASTGSGGLKYMQDNAFGRTVTLLPDYSGAVYGMDGRWNLMYVYLSTSGSTSTYGNELLNTRLLRYGFAEVDERYAAINQYSAFLTEQRNAKSIKTGMWGDGLNYYTLNDRVNVNTATRAILEDNMLGNDVYSAISGIIRYRSYGVFRTVDELKYADGMTRELFDANRYLFSVITNINSATEKELKTLEYPDTDDIANILDYRAGNSFSSLTELYQKAGVSRDFYDRNRYYMAVDDNTKVVYAKPNSTVNVNTASQSQLANISDVGSTAAARIVNARANGYTLKSLMELREIAGLSTERVHRLADNCNLYTDVNSATVTELESLFSSSYVSSEINKIVSYRRMSSIERLRDAMSAERYNKISKFVYVDELTLPERVNLNTATETQLNEIGMTYNEARSIVSARKKMLTPSQIPINVANYDSRVVLYTNINTASARELNSLNAFSESMVTRIMGERDYQPFGSENELEKFFEENGALSAYNSVKEFIVVR